MKRTRLLGLLLLALALVAPPLARAATQVGIVTTPVGTAGQTGAADGVGPAARFARPLSIALSGDGAVALIADTDNHTLRRLDVATGAVTTLAGKAGQSGAADGAGDTARFALPSGVALNISGTLALVADTNNHTVRRLDVTTGAVTTLAGTPGQAGSTDAYSATARFNRPEAVALSTDGTFALVADTGNHTVRRLDVATGAVTTLAGAAGSPGADDGIGSAARFNLPRGLALSRDGAFALVADSGNHTVRRLDVATGVVTTLAGTAGLFGATDGSGASAQFAFPRGVAISADGVYALVANFSGSTVRRIELATGAVTTLAGAAGRTGSADGIGTNARFAYPAGVALGPDGLTLVIDTYNHTVRRIEMVAVEPRLYLPLARRAP